MGIGGKFLGRDAVGDAALDMAYSGKTFFRTSGWHHCERAEWTLDYLNSGSQRQKAGGSPEFVRVSGVAALYEPCTRYREYREKGTSLDESYITFRLSERRAVIFRRLTGPEGWVHVRDPDSCLENLFRRLAELLFYRGPGSRLEATGIFLELLGMVEGSISIDAALRQVRRGGKFNAGRDMAAVVERYVKENIDRPIEVGELASLVGLGISTFAHKYPLSCGETPYQTVLRVKVEAAKRLLLWRNLSVSEVSARTGFSSPFHLSKVFKSLEGLSPREWTQSLREKGEPTAGPHVS